MWGVCWAEGRSSRDWASSANATCLLLRRRGTSDAVTWVRQADAWFAVVAWVAAADAIATTVVNGDAAAATARVVVGAGATALAAAGVVVGSWVDEGAALLLALVLGLGAKEALGTSGRTLAWLEACERGCIGLDGSWR